MSRKSLDIVGETQPKVLETVRQLDAAGMSPERIAKELFAKFRLDVSRNAVISWLRDNPAEVVQP